MRELSLVGLFALIGPLGCGHSVRGDGDATSGSAGMGQAATDDGPGVDAGALPPFPAVSTNGSRLRARQWVTEGGARLPDTMNIDGNGAQAWYDTVLETPCAFQRVAEAFACLPLTPFEVLTGVLDGDCNLPLEQPIAVETIAVEKGGPAHITSLVPAARAGRCAEHRYALDHGLSSVDTQSRAPCTGVYELADPTDLAAWGNPYPNNNCARAQPIDGRPIHAVGGRLELSDLVTAEARVVDTSRRLGVTQLAASDGSTETTSLYDTALDSECSPLRTTDGKMRCVPPIAGHVYTGYGFPGFPGPYANCQSIWGQWQEEHTELPVSGYVTEITSPGLAPSHVYRILPLGAATRCDELTRPPGFDLALELVALESLVALYDVTTSYGTLSLRLLTDRQSASAVRQQAWDTSNQQACAFQLATDGRGRCFPASLPAAYAGYECGGPPLAKEVNHSPDPASQATYVREWQGELCSGGLALRPRGDLVAKPGGASERSQGDLCSPVFFSPDIPDQNPDFYSAGEALDLELFVAATLEVD